MDKCVKCGEPIYFGDKDHSREWKIDKHAKRKTLVTVQCSKCGTYNTKEVEE